MFKLVWSVDSYLSPACVSVSAYLQDAARLVRSLNPHYGGYVGVTLGWFTSNAQMLGDTSYLDFMRDTYKASGLHKYLGMPPKDVRPYCFSPRPVLSLRLSRPPLVYLNVLVYGVGRFHLNGPVPFPWLLICQCIPAQLSNPCPAICMPHTGWLWVMLL